MSDKINNIRMRYASLLRRSEAEQMLHELGLGRRTLEKLINAPACDPPIRRFITRADKQHRYDREALIAAVMTRT